MAHLVSRKCWKPNIVGFMAGTCSLVKIWMGLLYKICKYYTVEYFPKIPKGYWQKPFLFHQSCWSLYTFLLNLHICFKVLVCCFKLKNILSLWFLSVLNILFCGVLNTRKTTGSIYFIFWPRFVYINVNNVKPLLSIVSVKLKSMQNPLKIQRIIISSLWFIAICSKNSFFSFSLSLVSCRLLLAYLFNSYCLCDYQTILFLSL